MKAATRVTAYALSALALAALPISAAHAGTWGDAEIDGDTVEDDTVVMTAAEAENLGRSSVAPIGSAHNPRYKRMTAVTCERAESPMRPQWVRDACRSNEEQLAALECPPEARRLDGLWRSEWDEAAAAYGPWLAVNAGSCLVAADLQAEAQRAFEVLTIPAPEPSIQPAQWALVNVHSPVSVTTPVQRFDVELLGIPVVLDVSATTFTWDFGDGSAPLLTQDPGRTWQQDDPIPDESWVGHTWTRTGTYPVTMTTTWQGRFAIAGTDTWENVDGEITTTSPVGPIQVLEARSQLVDGTLG